MSQQNIIRKWWHVYLCVFGFFNRDALNACGRCSQYWCFVSCYQPIFCSEQYTMSAELAPCYSWCFPCENSSQPAQQRSVPLEFQSKWLARSLTRSECPGLRQMLDLLFADVQTSWCSSGHVTCCFPEWREKRSSFILSRLIFLFC